MRCVNVLIDMILDRAVDKDEGAKATADNSRTSDMPFESPFVVEICCVAHLLFFHNSTSFLLIIHSSVRKEKKKQTLIMNYYNHKFS